MRAGKKQVAESGQTRPCIVYLKNLREEAETAGGRLRKRDPRELQLQQREQALRETTRRTGRSVGVAVQEKPTSRTRQAQVAAKSPAVVASPSPPKGTPKTTPTAAAAIMAKRRSTLVMGNSHQKLTGIGPRRGTHTETPATPKMYKQAAAKLLAPSPPPTIAASRSRRSIKPNPRYASEDLVTPKYMASLSGDGGGSPVSSVSRHRSLAKPMYTEISDLLDLDEDNDDELADAAFNPQLHKSDEDDDDEEFISDGEFEQELRLEKLPAAKRGRGRPPKANNVRTPSSAAANTAAAASSRVFHKLEVNSAQGRSPATNIQQLRRTLAGTIARNNASMTGLGGGGGGGGGGAAAKRKLEASESESPVARKRLVISSSSGGGQRSVPVVNGAAKRSTTPSAHATTTTISRPKVGGAGNTPRMQPQRSAGVFKVNPATPNTPIPSGANSSTRFTRGAAGGGGGAGAAASEASTKVDLEADDMPTFTIVNIDDIINQDDVLITRSNNAAAAAAAAAVARGGASKKLPKGRLRGRDILTSVATPAAEKKTLSSIEKSPPAAISSQAAKRLKILGSSSNSNSSGNTKPRAPSQAVHHQAAPVPKPRPRILNTEMGKKTQPMKPLMSMGKELCPTDVDTEEDDPDLDFDLDLDELPAPIVTRRSAPRQAQGLGSGAGPAETGTAASSNKWNSNRRNVLATTASTNAANARADRKLTKLLAEASDEPAVFKKPSVSPQRRSKENHQQQQQQQEQRDKEETSSKKDSAPTAAATAAGQATNTAATVLSSPQKYFPPETTIFSEEEGRVVKKITCYETWHVINLPTSPTSTTTRQQRTCLELALVKLANVAARIKVPSSKWSSKVTLYKVSPTLMQRQTMTIFTGDLNAYNIPEEDRHKYQPSCVLFRRSAVDKTKSRVPYDRAIIFKNKCFYANIDGKQVNLMGAPDAVTTVKEVEILLDIVDRLSLNSQLVEMVNTK